MGKPKLEAVTFTLVGTRAFRVCLHHGTRDACSLVHPICLLPQTWKSNSEANGVASCGQSPGYFRLAIVGYSQNGFTSGFLSLARAGRNKWDGLCKATLTLLSCVKGPEWGWGSHPLFGVTGLLFICFVAWGDAFKIFLAQFSPQQASNWWYISCNKYEKQHCTHAYN